MKQLFYILPLAILMVFTSCDKNEDGDPIIPDGVIDSSTVSLNFDFVYGDENFEENKVYDYSLGYHVKFEKLRLYVSNVRLISKEGEVVNGPEIIFVNAFADSNVVTFKVPVGDYDSVAFSIGVPPELNGTDNPDFDAALYDTDHPLSLTNGMYWTWNSGYRFILMDGRMNRNPMEDGIFETLVSLHTGKDYSFRSTKINQEFNVTKDQTVNLKLRFDVSGFIDNPNDVIDLVVDNQTHGENAPLANRVSDNAIISVKFE
jgi:hypothetical protein